MSKYPKQTIMVCTKCGLTEPQNKQNKTGHCSRCDTFHMVVKAGSQIYLTADEIQIIKKALDAYFDHCGEVIADYKESETLEMPHTDFETENYNEALRVRNVIRLSLTRKLK